MKDSILTPEISIRIIRSLEEWDQQAICWDEVWAQTEDASVFNCYAFLRACWCRYLKRSSTLFILVFEDSSGRALGFAPFICKKYWLNGLPLRVMQLIYEEGISDRPQLLFSTQKDELFGALFHFLAENDSEWDLLEFNEQELTEEYSELLSSTFSTGRKYYYQSLELEPQPYLARDEQVDTWDKYLATRSKNHRKKWRNQNNRLTKEGEVTLTRHSNSQDLHTAIHEYIELEKKSWKSKDQMNINPETYDFYLELSNSLSPHGGIHFLFLRLNGVPIAGHIGMSCGKRYAGLQSVFDAAYDYFSPGSLVGGYDMKWALEEGYREYDFMSGFLSDKLSWTDTVRKISYVLIIRKKSWGWLYYLFEYYVIPTIRKVGKKIRSIKFIANKRNIDDET